MLDLPTADKLSSSTRSSVKQISFSNSIEQVQPSIVFDVASLILYGCQATPIHFKILLDRLFSVIQHEEVVQILHCFGWSYEDYARGYMLRDSTGRVLDRWVMATTEDESIILQQFLRFGETKNLAEHWLREHIDLQQQKQQQQQQLQAGQKHQATYKTQVDFKKFLEKGVAASNAPPTNQNATQSTGPLANLGIQNFMKGYDTAQQLLSRTFLYPQQLTAATQGFARLLAGQPNLFPLAPVAAVAAAVAASQQPQQVGNVCQDLKTPLTNKSPLKSLQTMEPFDYRKDATATTNNHQTSNNQIVNSTTPIIITLPSSSNAINNINNNNNNNMTSTSLSILSKPSSLEDATGKSTPQKWDRHTLFNMSINNAGIKLDPRNQLILDKTQQLANYLKELQKNVLVQQNGVNGLSGDASGIGSSQTSEAINYCVKEPAVVKIENKIDTDSTSTKAGASCADAGSLSSSSPFYSHFNVNKLRGQLTPTRKPQHPVASPSKRPWQPTPGYGGTLISPSGKKRVLCTACHKTFCDKGALKIHYSAVHLKEMHKCTVEGCTMMFSSRRSRNRHSANPNPKLHMPQAVRRKIVDHLPNSSGFHQGNFNARMDANGAIDDENSMDAEEGMQIVFSPASHDEEDSSSEDKDNQANYSMEAGEGADKSEGVKQNTTELYLSILRNGLAIRAPAIEPNNSNLPMPRSSSKRKSSAPTRCLASSANGGGNKMLRMQFGEEYSRSESESNSSGSEIDKNDADTSGCEMDLDEFALCLNLKKNTPEKRAISPERTRTNTGAKHCQKDSSINQVSPGDSGVGADEKIVDLKTIFPGKTPTNAGSCFPFFSRPEMEAQSQHEALDLCVTRRPDTDAPKADSSCKNLLDYQIPNVNFEEKEFGGAFGKFVVSLSMNNNPSGCNLTSSSVGASISLTTAGLKSCPTVTAASSPIKSNSATRSGITNLAVLKSTSCSIETTEPSSESFLNKAAALISSANIGLSECSTTDSADELFKQVINESCYTKFGFKGDIQKCGNLNNNLNNNMSKNGNKNNNNMDNNGVSNTNTSFNRFSPNRFNYLSKVGPVQPFGALDFCRSSNVSLGHNLGHDLGHDLGHAQLVNIECVKVSSSAVLSGNVDAMINLKKPVADNPQKIVSSDKDSSFNCSEVGQAELYVGQLEKKSLEESPILQSDRVEANNMMGAVESVGVFDSVGVDNSEEDTTVNDTTFDKKMSTEKPVSDQSLTAYDFCETDGAEEPSLETKSVKSKNGFKSETPEKPRYETEIPSADQNICRRKTRLRNIAPTASAMSTQRKRY